MLISDFDYELPQELIARYPAKDRRDSRLLVADRGIADFGFADLPSLLRPDDLLLFNNTRVIPARLYARRPTGRTFELLLLKMNSEERWEALLRPSARARTGASSSISRAMPMPFLKRC